MSPFISVLPPPSYCRPHADHKHPIPFPFNPLLCIEMRVTFRGQEQGKASEAPMARNLRRSPPQGRARTLHLPDLLSECFLRLCTCGASPTSSYSWPCYASRCWHQTLTLPTPTADTPLQDPREGYPFIPSLRPTNLVPNASVPLLPAAEHIWAVLYHPPLQKSSTCP